MQEIWKDIPNYSGYQVSNLGNVRTFNKITYTDYAGIRHWKDRILKQKMTTNKYGRKDCRVELWNNGKHKTYLVARLVTFTFYNQPLESKLTVNHKDGNSLNNNINNLEIITRKENIQHYFDNDLCGFQKKIKIISKLDGNSIYLNSLSKGSKYIRKAHNYLSSKIKKNVFENNEYIWQLI